VKPSFSKEDKSTWKNFKIFADSIKEESAIFAQKAPDNLTISHYVRSLQMLQPLTNNNCKRFNIFKTIWVCVTFKVYFQKSIGRSHFTES
jgi:hypothetical protein